MSLHRQVKINGRKCLANNWGKAVAIVLLSLAVYLLFAIVETIISTMLGISIPNQSFRTMDELASNIPDTSILSLILTTVMAIGSFLIIVPLNLGITGWYQKLSDGYSDDILTIFSCFSNRNMMLRSLGLYLNIGIRTLIVGILHLIIPVCTIVLSSWTLHSGKFDGAYFVGSLGMVFGIILLCVLGTFFLIYVQKYFLCKYYLLDGKTTVKDAVRSSIQATRGLRDSIFLYKLSFIGWAILGIFSLPLLYIIPYYSSSSMLYARFLIEQDRQENKLAVYQPPVSEAEAEATSGAIHADNFGTMREDFPETPDPYFTDKQPVVEEDFTSTRPFEAYKTDDLPHQKPTQSNDFE